MDAAAVVFFLVAILHNGDAFSFTDLASFQSQAECEAAAQIVDGAVQSGQKTVEIGCLSSSAIDQLRKGN